MVKKIVQRMMIRTMVNQTLNRVKRGWGTITRWKAFLSILNLIPDPESSKNLRPWTACGPMIFTAWTGSRSITWQGLKY